MPPANGQEAATTDVAAVVKAMAKAKAAAAAAKAKAKAKAAAAAAAPQRRTKSVLRAAALSAAKKFRRQANKYGTAATCAAVEKGFMYNLKKEYEDIVDEVHRSWPDDSDEILDGDEFGPIDTVGFEVP
jgi:hypothetical protein